MRRTPKTRFSRRRFLHATAVGWVGSIIGLRRTGADERRSGVAEIEVTLVDKDAVGYGTFQNHNQKIVQNRGGIFMTHIRSRNQAYTAQQWRLSRSTDGGQTFQTLFEATHATNPPVLETDAEGNVYLMRVDFVDHNAYLYRFLAPDYKPEPVISKIPGAAAGKYAMMLDPERERLYFFAHNGTFHVIGLDGKVQSSIRLTSRGKFGGIQYPHLALAADGTLHAPWTSQKYGRYCYRSVQHIQSPDGGKSWQRMDGTPITPPVPGDETGPSKQISLEDEFEEHSWLCSCVPKRRKVHFLYSTLDSHSDAPKSPLIRMNYVRCDAETGKKDFHRTDDFRGTQVKLNKWNGFMATRRLLPDSPLYAVMADDERLACLVSENNGQSWDDYAVGTTRYTDCYSIGGCREVTDDGYILGSFTDRVQSSLDPKGVCPVYFFKIKAGVKE